jgi:hypothetical protein
MFAWLLGEMFSFSREDDELEKCLAISAVRVEILRESDGASVGETCCCVFVCEKAKDLLTCDFDLLARTAVRRSRPFLRIM